MIITVRNNIKLRPRSHWPRRNVSGSLSLSLSPSLSVFYSFYPSFVFFLLLYFVWMHSPHTNRTSCIFSGFTTSCGGWLCCQKHHLFVLCVCSPHEQLFLFCCFFVHLFFVHCFIWWVLFYFSVSAGKEILLFTLANSRSLSFGWMSRENNFNAFAQQTNVDESEAITVQKQQHQQREGMKPRGRERERVRKKQCTKFQSHTNWMPIQRTVFEVQVQTQFNKCNWINTTIISFDILDLSLGTHIHFGQTFDLTFFKNSTHTHTIFVYKLIFTGFSLSILYLLRLSVYLFKFFQLFFSFFFFLCSAAVVSFRKQNKKIWNTKKCLPIIVHIYLIFSLVPSKHTNTHRVFR